MSKGVDIACFVTQILLILAAVIGAGWLTGCSLALLAGGVYLAFTLAYNVAPFPVPSYLLIIGTTLLAVGLAQAAGVYRGLANMTQSVFRKARWLMPFVAGLAGFCVSLLTGTEHLAYCLLPYFIHVAKLTGQRPSKSLAATVVGAILGLVCSPFGGAYDDIYNMTQAVGLSQVSYINEGIVLIPSCLVGTLVAAACTLIEGKDLEKDEAFKKRLLRGQLNVEGCERYIPESQHAEMRRNRMLRLSGFLDERVSQPSRGISKSVTETTKRGTTLKASPSSRANPPLRDFSNISVLSEGDFVFSCARHEKGQDNAIDINDRELKPGVSRRATSTRRDEPTAEPAEADVEDEAMAQPDRGKSNVREKHATKSSILIITIIAWLGFSFIAIWNWLHNTQTSIIPMDRQPNAEAVIIGVNLVVSLLIFLVSPMDPMKMAYQSASYTGLCTVVNAGIMSVLLGAFVEHWNYDISDRAISWISSQAWCYCFLLIFVSLFSYSQTRATSLISSAALLDNMRLVNVVAMVPAVSLTTILPIHPLILSSILFDDTGCTKSGRFLLDHPFIFPGLVGAAVAMGISYGIGAAYY